MDLLQQRRKIPMMFTLVAALFFSGGANIAQAGLLDDFRNAANTVRNGLERAVDEVDGLFNGGGNGNTDDANDAILNVIQRIQALSALVQTESEAASAEIGQTDFQRLIVEISTLALESQILGDEVEELRELSQLGGAIAPAAKKACMQGLNGALIAINIITSVLDGSPPPQVTATLKRELRLINLRLTVFRHLASTDFPKIHPPRMSTRIVTPLDKLRKIVDDNLHPFNQELATDLNSDINRLGIQIAFMANQQEVFNNQVTLITNKAEKDTFIKDLGKQIAAKFQDNQNLLTTALNKL